MQSMYTQMVGRAGSIQSPLYSMLFEFIWFYEFGVEKAIVLEYFEWKEFAIEIPHLVVYK